MRTRESQVRQDLEADPFFEPWLARLRRHGLTCCVALPVVVGDVVDGVLNVYSAEPHSFDELAQSLLEDLAADLGFGLARLRDAAALVRSSREADAAVARLRATMDSLLDPFVRLEAVRDVSGALVDLRYVEANRAAVAYNRRPREELIGATMLELFPGLLEHGPLASYFEAIETGEPMVLDDVAYSNEVLGETRQLRPARREERRRSRADVARRDRPLRRPGGAGPITCGVPPPRRARVRLRHAQHPRRGHRVGLAVGDPRAGLDA